jgi:hypothetical protein
MMKTGRNVKHPIFIFCCILFIAHQIIQKGFGIHIPWVHSYLDDLLVMPIILTLILIERRKLFGWGEAFSFSGLETLGLVFSLSLLFEWVFPYFSDKFTFDWWDFLAYALGGWIYFRYLNT